MSRKAFSGALTLTVSVLVATAAGAGSAPAGSDERPITADEAAAIAVNDLSEHGGGYHLRHPRRVVDFTPDGVRVEGRRGAPEWTWTLDRVSSSAGQVLVDGDPVAPVAVEQTLIRYDRCVLHEDYRLKENSVEQLLVIPEPLPLEGGDLVITGAVACEGALAEDERGWAWRGPHGEVTMGRVTVLDAEGCTLPTRLEVTATLTRLVVDGSALLTAAYPVVVDPELGSNDYRISDMGPNSDPDHDAFSAAVEYNSVNNTYLVVWAGDDDWGGLVEGEYEIFGQLLSGTSGSQTGWNDVVISDVGGWGSPSADAHTPAVAFDSTHNEFLVVWSADDPEGGCVDEELEIWGQFVDAELDPIHGGNFRISFNGGTGDPAFDALYPAVAYNPDANVYLVVWTADDTVQGMVDDEYEIFGQQVYAGGLVNYNFRISDMGGSGDPTYDAYDPDVTYNSTEQEFLVVWWGDDNSGGLVQDEFEIFGQLLTWYGAGTGPNDFRISDMGGTGDPAYDAFTPSVAYNPLRNEYLVVWLGDDNVGGVVEGEVEVFSQRLNADAGGLGPNDFRLSDVGGLGNPDYDVVWGPEAAYSPILDQYMVVWAGEDNIGGMVDGECEIFAQMLNGDVSDGIGPNDERISDAGGIGELVFTTYWPVVAANTWNGEFLVAWHGDDSVGSLVVGEFEIFTQRMDGMAVFVDAFESADTLWWSSTVP